MLQYERECIHQQWNLELSRFHYGDLEIGKSSTDHINNITLQENLEQEEEAFF